MSELAHSISLTENGFANLPNVYGDIVLTPEQMLDSNHEPSLVQGFFNGSDKWPNATVPYWIYPNLSELENLLNVSYMALAVTLRLISKLYQNEYAYLCVMIREGILLPYR